MSEISEIGRCYDGACEDYDLCEVVFNSPNDGFNNRIICEGFKISGKLNAERKKNSACYEGYGWKLSNVEWEWELTAPCDSPFFDKRFKTQFCDKMGMSITGFVLKGCGTDDWVGKETLTGCIITEIGREYGEGVTRTIKGVALHHKILDGTGSSGKRRSNTANAVARAGLGVLGNSDVINAGLGVLGNDDVISAGLGVLGGGTYNLGDEIVNTTYGFLSGGFDYLGDNVVSPAVKGVRSLIG